MARVRKFALWTGIVGVLAFAPMLWFDLAPGESTCQGTPRNGSVSGAVRLPAWGANYRSYCRVCIPALRTYGHAPVIETVVAAYDALAESHPDTVWVYGEIGLPWGGRFRPHRTHRNGLSVDFMAPLREGTLPTHALNRFGYDVDTDAGGRLPDGAQIDFAAMAAHLGALDRAARAGGGRVALVILDPRLQDDLFRTPEGARLKSRLRFNRAPSWVRHDDHYHVNFDFPCSA